MIRAGLVAKAAVEHGLAPPAWVKTSLAPGSRAVTRYLEDAGLLAPLEQIGFQVVGYACASCGGKSGPLKPEAMELAKDGLPLVAVLSGNRNFDGRIHPMLDASYLCSPGLVVAYALSGRLDFDIDNDPIAQSPDGHDVFLRNLWPADEDVDKMVRQYVTPATFAVGAAAAEESWRRLEAPEGELFPWDPASSYIMEPPFFDQMPSRQGGVDRIEGARTLALFGDGLTTDHVSPGGEILLDSPAGHYLTSLGISRTDFNTYVGRRGNYEVMVRATYANIRIQNSMVPDREGGWTRLWPEGEIVSMFDASAIYRKRAIPLVVLAGRDFGIGSSRDWAAKGPALLGVRAIIAKSFERIHRSNLIGLGIMPLLFSKDDGPDTLGLDGSETIDLSDLVDAVRDGLTAHAVAHHRDGRMTEFSVTVDIRSSAESDLLLGDGMFKAALAALNSAAETLQTMEGTR
jgi:aconitate hydratase